MISQKISTNYSEGVADEIVALKGYQDSQYEILHASRTVNDYITNKETSSVAAKEYAKLLSYLPKGPLKILDIGVGMGQSSALLASKGHEVYALEPNPVYCDIIAQLAKKMNLNIRTIEGVAEDLDKLGEQNFDVVFFNASLHHCDQPNKALENSYNLLKQDGYIVLASENYLRPWMSKKRWYYKLEHFPEQMGHYGGNEHVYYNWEYVNFLKTNRFRHIQLTPSAYETEPLERLEVILSKRINGVRVYSPSRVMARLLYYMTTSAVLKSTFLFNLLSRTSVVAANFIGRKASKL
ncbi:methyltransferase domain-containing protein [Spirosoma sp. HMF3257]|uniref:Methyltransferase type 11 domain-containing protein n=1 Tax=Spirosoma telluris TaxID=2183553 RepID=A0A327NLB1_9BACT|nr:methyltransferase domain-containing protein [Spirosoma telluris]RAI76100.1 hypothetical protein HMF3257_21380 [Spirosoma telluris]